jgi:hypothetical protein
MANSEIGEQAQIPPHQDRKETARISEGPLLLESIYI